MPAVARFQTDPLCECSWIFGWSEFRGWKSHALRNLLAEGRSVLRPACELAF